jgi:hypothetical protein
MSDLRVYDKTLDLSSPKWEELTSYERMNLPANASTRPHPNWSNMELRTPYTPSLARQVWDKKTSTEEAELAKSQKPIDTRIPFKGRLGQIPLPKIGTFDPLPTPQRSSVDVSDKKVRFSDTTKAKGLRRKTKRRQTKRRQTKRRQTKRRQTKRRQTKRRRYNLSKK